MYETKNMKFDEWKIWYIYYVPNEEIKRKQNGDKEDKEMKWLGFWRIFASWRVTINEACSTSTS